MNAPKSESTTGTAPPPKYRYFTVTPASVTLSVRDVVDALPPGTWQADQPAASEKIQLRCSDLFSGNSPRIAIETLRDLFPGRIPDQETLPDLIPLPTAKIALAYRPEIRRELVPTSPPPLPPETKDREKTAPGPNSETATAVPAAPAEARDSKPPGKPLPSWKRLLKPVLAPPPAETPQPPATETAPTAPDKPTDSADPAKPESTPVISTEIPAGANAKSDPPLESSDRSGMPDQYLLQRILMTDEDLTLQRALDLSGGLPGIRGCVIVDGDRSITSADMPSDFDIRALSSGARDLLEALRRNSANSGVCLESTITLYSDHGPVSFLESGGTALLVLHRDRGFFPGVREKLSELLGVIQPALASGEKLE